MKQTYQELADRLLPFILQAIGQRANQGSGVASAGALMADGSVALAGNLSVNAGITIDSVDISLFKASFDATLISAGAGLSGGGPLGSTITVAMGVPSPVSVSSTSSASGTTHSHAVVSSSNPGVAASILNTASNGHIFIRQATFGNTATTPHLNEGIHATRATVDTIGVGTTASPAALTVLSATQQVRFLYDTSNHFGITVASNGTATLLATGTNASIRTDATIATTTYASQVTGWAITGAGEADFRYLYVDEMHAKMFIADLEQALAGGQIISKSVAMLFSAFTAPAAGATALLVVRDLPSAPGMAVFQNSDFVRLRTFARAGGSLTIGDCWGTVVLDTSYGTGGFLNNGGVRSQRYTFTRSSGADAGAMSAGTVLQPDLVILDYGVSGNGIVETTTVDGTYGANSPYVHVATWTTHPRTMTERVRLGHLRGITSTANEYGLFIGPNNAADTAYIVASNVQTAINNIPLSLVSSGVTRIAMRTSPAPYLSAGAAAPSEYAPAGSTSTGMWAGMDAGVFKFRLGTTVSGALTSGLVWDGSSLTVAGNGSGITNINGSNITTGTVTLDRLQAFERSDNLAYNSDFRITRYGSLNVGVNAAAPDGYFAYSNAGLSGIQELLVYNVDDPPSGGAVYVVRFTTPTNGVMGMVGYIGRATGKSDFKWAANSSYIISFYARCFDGSYAGTIGMTADLYWNQWPTGGLWISNPPLTFGWQRYVVRITFGATPESSDAIYISFGPVGGANKSGDIAFTAIQVERCKATDTVPSPYRSNSGRQLGSGLIAAATGTIQATGLYATAQHLSFVEMYSGIPYHRAGIVNDGYFYLRGHPSAAAAFVDFDPATGKFRGGRFNGAGYTSPTFEWETDSNSGKILAGGGRVKLGADGVSLISNVGYNAEHAIKWYDDTGSVLISRLYSFMEASTSGSFGTWLYADSNNPRKLSTLIASYNNVGGAQSALQATYIVSTSWRSLISAESTATGSIIQLSARNGSNSSRILLQAPAAGGEYIDYIAVGGHFFQEGPIALNPIAAPGTPAFGRVYLYVDSADNKLKAKGSSGTVTILANP